MDVNQLENNIFLRSKLFERPLKYILAFIAPTNSYRNGQWSRRRRKIRVSPLRKLVRHRLGIQKRFFEKGVHGFLFLRKSKHLACGASKMSGPALCKMVCNDSAHRLSFLQPDERIAICVSKPFGDKSFKTS